MAPIKRATLISTTRSDPAVISFSPAPVVSSVLSLSLRPSVPVLPLLHHHHSSSTPRPSPFPRAPSYRPFPLALPHSRARAHTHVCVLRFALLHVHCSRITSRACASCEIHTQVRKLPFEQTPTHACRRRCTYKVSANVANSRVYASARRFTGRINDFLMYVRAGNYIKRLARFAGQLFVR